MVSFSQNPIDETIQHMKLKRRRTGITTITVYSPIMFTLAGYSTRKSQLLAGINNIGACLCSLIGMVLIDRVGRRRLLWAGAVGLGLCMFLEVSVCHGETPLPHKVFINLLVQ